MVRHFQEDIIQHNTFSIAYQTKLLRYTSCFRQHLVIKFPLWGLGQTNLVLMLRSQDITKTTLKKSGFLYGTLFSL